MLSEASACLLVTVALISGAGALAGAQWRRTQCAYLVFEQTHAARLGRRAPSIGMPSGFRIIRGPDGIRGQARCGDALEEVFLPWLEEPPSEMSGVL